MQFVTASHKIIHYSNLDILKSHKHLKLEFMKDTIWYLNTTLTLFVLVGQCEQTLWFMKIIVCVLVSFCLSRHAQAWIWQRQVQNKNPNLWNTDKKLKCMQRNGWRNLVFKSPYRKVTAQVLILWKSLRYPDNAWSLYKHVLVFHSSGINWSPISAHLTRGLQDTLVSPGNEPRKTKLTWCSKMADSSALGGGKEHGSDSFLCHLVVVWLWVRYQPCWVSASSFVKTGIKTVAMAQVVLRLKRENTRQVLLGS